MKSLHSTKLAAANWLTVFAVLSLSAGVVQAQEGENWLKHLRVGALVGLNVKTKFTMGGDFSVSGSSPGSAGAGGTHTYDDGYVKPDQTGASDNLTSFWGYNNAGQFDAGAQTLTFHSTQSFNAGNSSHEEKDVQLGLDIAYGGDLGRALGGWYGWEFGFSFLPMSMKDNRDIPGTFNRVEHQYSTVGITPPTVNDGPYQGGPSGVGPLLDNTAIDLGSSVTNGLITGSRTLHVNIYSVRLGPTMTWEIRPYFAVQVSGGPAVAYATGEYKFDEKLKFADGSQAKNKGSFSNDEFLYGGYVSALFMYHVVEGGDIYIGAQYMPLGSITVKGPGRKAEMELGSAIYLTAGINWPF
jgi:hypothetical protein